MKNFPAFVGFKDLLKKINNMLEINGLGSYIVDRYQNLMLVDILSLFFHFRFLELCSNSRVPQILY